MHIQSCLSPPPSPGTWCCPPDRPYTSNWLTKARRRPPTSGLKTVCTLVYYYTPYTHVP